MELHELAEKVKTYFQNKEVAAVYLFGSYVKGKNRSGSDADIGILYPEGISSVERFERNLDYAVELEETLNIPVDIVDVERADAFFLHQLMLNKIIVLDKEPHRRVEFEVKRRREFFDNKKFYDLYHQQALKRLEERAAKYDSSKE